MSVRRPYRSRSTSLGVKVGFVKQSDKIPRIRIVHWLVILAWNTMLSWEFRNDIVAPTDSSKSAIFVAASFRVPRISSRVVSSATPDFPEGSDDVPARMLPWIATVGFMEFL